jgi:asparagine synthase (glutamine-hydrolysing)
MGFGPPDASWYKGQLRAWIEEVLAAHLRDDRGIFRPEYVRQMLQSHFAGHKNNYHLIWSLLNFETWCQAFGCFGATSVHQSSAA